MPNIKSSKKRVKVTLSKTLKNKSLNSALKTAIKKATVSINNKTDETANTVRAALKKIDSSKSKGLIHKNTAARRKSRLARKFNSAS